MKILNYKVLTFIINLPIMEALAFVLRMNKQRSKPLHFMGISITRRTTLAVSHAAKSKSEACDKDFESAPNQWVPL